MVERYILEEIDEVLHDISKAVDADRSTFYLLNQETGILESIVAQGVEDFVIEVPLGKGIIGRCIELGCPMMENDPQGSLFFDGMYDTLLGYHTKSVICVPVRDEFTAIIGGIQSLNSKKGSFNFENVKVLSSFSSILSVLIKNVRGNKLRKNSQKSYSKLLDVFAKVSSELDFESLVPLIMAKAAEITSSERSTLYFLDTATGMLKSKYAKGLKGITLEADKGIAGLTVRTQKPYLINHPYEHPLFDRSVDKVTGFTTNSILSVPIFRVEGEVMGVVQAINHKKGKYGEEELAVLQGFADQVRIVIKNALLFGQINGMKNYLNVLIENMDSGIVTIDNEGTIQTMNKKFIKMFELGNSNAVATFPHLDAIKGELHQILRHCLFPFETKKKYLEYDLEYSLGKTRRLIFNLSALPMENQSGELVGVIGVFQDVSKEKRIRSNLSRYIPQHLVNEVINKDNLSFMHSKHRKCSVLFSDIRNFTTLTETLGATEIVKLLNRYFDLMVDAIHENHGVLDKFIGDAVMGVFGLPYTNVSDPVNAIHCALRMFEKLDALNRSNIFKTHLNIGIGISTGMVISGNIGSDKRYEYTVIGDPVNLASRLESETKTYKERILICSTTYKAVSDHFLCKPIGKIAIKGKVFPEEVYTVLGAKEHDIPIFSGKKAAVRDTTAAEQQN